MFLSLASLSFALTVPVSARLTDDFNNNGTEGFKQSITGTVAVTNPATGAVYRIGDEELTVNKRTASGGGSVRFAGDPAGTTRSWALYYLDANGTLLGDPEIVLMSFDDNGNGAIAARDGATGLVTSLGGSPTPLGTIWDGIDLRVNVQDGGVDATLIGIIELDHEGPSLTTNADMTLLDANTYAAFQGLRLDAVLAIDSRQLTLQGDITVNGLAVATNGTVEGGADLQWDVTFYDPDAAVGCGLKGGCEGTTLVALGSVSYLESIGAVKRKSGQPAAVKLQPADVLYDTWDTNLGVVVEGDMSDLELSAVMAFDGVGECQVVTLDPGSVGVTWELGGCGGNEEPCNDAGSGGCCTLPDIFIDGDCDECGDYDFVIPTDPPDWVFLAAELLEVEVLDSAGGVVATHFCTLAPTASTVAGTKSNDTLIGECTSGTAGTEVRRLRATFIDSDLGEYSVVKFDLEMGGSAFAAEPRAGGCTKLGGCTDTVSVLEGTVGIWNDGVLIRNAGPIGVTEAEFVLPFSFAAESTAGTYGDALGTGLLEVEFADPKYDLAWVADEDGINGYYGDHLMRTIAFADVDLVSNRQELRCDALGGGTRGVMTSRCTAR